MSAAVGERHKLGGRLLGRAVPGSAVRCGNLPRQMANHLPSQLRREAIEQFRLRHRAQPGKLALGELARGVDAALAQRGAVIRRFEMFPSRAVADAAHRGQTRVERIIPAQSRDFLH